MRSPSFTPASAEGGACNSSVPASAVLSLNVPFAESMSVTSPVIVCRPTKLPLTDAEGLADGDVTVPPSIVAEVITDTPRDARRDRIEKAADYAAFGVRWYWLVDPELRSIEIFELGRDGHWRSALAAVKGRLRVPGCRGLVLDVTKLWREVDALFAERPDHVILETMEGHGSSAHRNRSQAEEGEFSDAAQAVRHPPVHHTMHRERIIRIDVVGEASLAGRKFGRLRHRLMGGDEGNDAIKVAALASQSGKVHLSRLINVS